MTNSAEQIRNLIKKGFRNYDIIRMLKVPNKKVVELRREIEGDISVPEPIRSYRNDTFIMNAY